MKNVKPYNHKWRPKCTSKWHREKTGAANHPTFSWKYFHICISLHHFNILPLFNHPLLLLLTPFLYAVCCRQSTQHQLSVHSKALIFRISHLSVYCSCNSGVSVCSFSTKCANYTFHTLKKKLRRLNIKQKSKVHPKYGHWVELTVLASTRIQ